MFQIESACQKTLVRTFSYCDAAKLAFKSVHLAIIDFSFMRKIHQFYHFQLVNRITWQKYQNELTLALALIVNLLC